VIIVPWLKENSRSYVFTFKTAVRELLTS